VSGDTVVSVIERYGYKNIVAIVYISAMFMQIMDGTIINVALPTLAEEFDVAVTAVDWTVLSFTLTLAVMTAAAGWFGDRFGLKRTFVASVVGFTVASALCGLSQSLEQLVVARAIQGAFAGAIAPVGSALLFGAFPLAERAAASRKVVTVVVIAPAIGPLVGGIILDITSWQWIFFVNVPMGLAAAVMAQLWLKENPSEPAAAFDLTGFLLAAAGLGLLLFGISRGTERGWDATSIQVSLVAGVVLLAALVFVELRTAQPLLPLRLLNDKLFGTMNLLTLPLYASFMGVIFLLPQFLQNEGDYTPFQAGLALLPQPIGILVMSQLSGRTLYKRFGPRRLITAGCLLGVASGLAIAATDPDSSLALVQLIMFVRGAAMGLIFVPIQAAAYATIAPANMSRATAILGTSRQIAPAIGIAIVSATLAAGLATATSATDRISSYQNAIHATTVMFALAILVAVRIDDSEAAATRN
jgi:EmrB/QacA subfamily drug resistance transporter